MVRTSLFTLGDRRITLEQLRAFACVAESGGFQYAALELHRSQSAITQSLQRLEEILECRLLERHQGHVLGLTVAGARFLPAVHDILARTSQAVGAIRQPVMAGPVKLGVPGDFQLPQLRAALTQYAARLPQMSVVVQSALSSELVRMFCNGLLDIAIVKRVATEPLIPQSQQLRQERLHWVAHQRLSLHAIDTLPLVLFPEGCAYRKLALACVAKLGKPSYCSYSSASYDNIRAAISAGLGIGILSHRALAKHHVILDGQDGFPPLPDVQLLMLQATPNDSVQQLADLLLNRPEFCR